MMKAIVLGGTSGMGRAIARLLASRGDSVFLMGIGSQDLERSAADLKERHPERAAAGYAVCDLEKPDGFAAALDAADAFLGSFDTVVVTAAMFATQDALEADAEFARRLVTVNYANTVVFCEHARKATARARRGEAHGVLVGGGRPRSQAGGHLRFEQSWPLYLPRSPRSQDRARRGLPSPASSRDS